MFYKEWMKYIKDDVKLTEVVMPGTHNSGSYGMIPFACCQNGSFYDQFAHGVRHFCIRYCGDKNKGIVLSHGLAKGKPLSHGLESMRRMIEENDSEFFVFDMREYYPQKIGPFSFTYPADDDKTAELINKYLDADKLAYTDYEKISEITFEKLRKSGKRFIILNYRDAYPWCRGGYDSINPWNPELHGKNPETFSKEVLSHFDNEQTDGIYWFQTQQTPGFGTEMGLTNPKKLDEGLFPYYQKIINAIKENEFYLASANVISGDFMTESYDKCREIIKLNLYKNTVKEELRDEFETELGKKYAF